MVALALLGLFACSALLYLQSPAAGERARGEALSALDKALQGKAEVDRLSLNLLGRELVLHGLKLRDPEGRLVAEIAEVRLRLGLTAFLRRRLLVREALVREPRLYLVSDRRGFNLARAVASKREELERTQPEEQRPSRLSFELERLAIEGGSARFVREGEERDLTASLDGLAGSGRAEWSGPDRSLRAELELAGRQRTPLEGALALIARVSVKDQALEGKVSLRAPGLELHAEGGRTSGGEVRVEVRSARLDPPAAAAFLERYPLQVPARLSGSVELRGNVASAHLDGAAGRTRVALRGALDVKRLWSDGLTLAAREVDLSELWPGGPSSSLQMDLSARGGGRTLGELVGEVQLSVPPSQVRGETLGPIQLTASAGHGRFHLPLLRAALPGMSLELEGDGTPEQVSLDGKVRVTDLARLSSALGRIRPGTSPALEGRGDLDFRVAGPLRHPGVSASGRFDRVRVGDLSVEGLALTASLPDVTRPLGAEATLQAAQAQASGRAFRRVLVQVGSEGREVRADARLTPLLAGKDGAMREAGELAAIAAGQRDEDSRGLLLRELTLRYAEATWTLSRPARLAFRDGFSAEPLELTSGLQRVSAGGSVARGALDVFAEARRLDLSLLPSAFVDPELHLAGLLGARVRARGPSRKLEVEAEVELDGGRVRQYDSLGLTLSGRWADDRARGKLRFSSRMARADARFDLPVRGLARHRREPLEVVLELEEQSIATALAAAGRPEKVTGTASASLTLGGTADLPAAWLSVRAKDLRLPDLPHFRLERPRVDVAVEAGENRQLRARVDLEDLGTTGEMVVRTPFRLPDLWDRPPDLKALLAAAYSVDASFRDLPLELLEAAGVRGLHGRVSLRAELRGTLENQVLNANLEGRGVARGTAAPTDVSVNVVAGERDVAASIHAHRGSQVLADLTARAGARLRALRVPGELEHVPLLVDGTVGPLSLAEWLSPPDPDGEVRPSRLPTALVAARLRGRGTLANPRLELAANFEQLRAGEACLGGGTLSYRYAGGLSTVAAALTSGQGRATANGTLKIDLSLPALRRGLDAGQAPLDAALEADGLNLAVLGSSIPGVRAISGQLSASARARGTLGAPRPRGWVEWRDGALALEGHGDYRAVQLRVEASDGAFKLARLEAQSGAGKLGMTATAERRGDRFRLAGQASMEKFPAIYGDQSYAAISTRLTLQGDLNGRVLDIQEISIPEAHVELPDVKRKDLQEIARPADIVLLRHGQPVDGKRKARPPAATGAAAPAGGKVSRQYRFSIRAPRNVWIKSSDVNVEIGFSERFRVEYAEDTRIYGDVRVLRGRITALGRDLEIQRDAHITFSGPPQRPSVDVTAAHVNKREQVTVLLTIRGQGKDLAIKASSQPPLAESEIYTLLATGRRTLKRGSGASLSGGEAASILGSLATTQLRNIVSQNLPLDVLSIEAGSGEGLRGTRVEVGTYLSDKAYLGGEVRIEANPSRGENTYGVRFEYQLTPRLSFQTEYGDARSGSADLIWSREY